jgi:hypothetical protein
VLTVWRDSDLAHAVAVVDAAENLFDVGTVRGLCRWGGLRGGIGGKRGEGEESDNENRDAG